MGSMIHLAVGRLEIDWGKNEGFRDHSALFQGEQDVTDVPYYYAGDEDGTDFEGKTKWKPLTECKEGLSKPLSLVIDRLNLLGHTYEQCEVEFAFLAQFNDFDDTRFTRCAGGCRCHVSLRRLRRGR
jgi:HEPN/Toprim N-terminal domain 1